MSVVSAILHITNKVLLSVRFHSIEIVKSTPYVPPSSNLSKNDFDFIKVVGKGSFGKVFLVRGKRDKQVYALKILSKATIVEKKQTEHTKSERLILQKINYPFLAQLHFAFQTERSLYLGMEFYAGGPLFFHLQQVYSLRPA